MNLYGKALKEWTKGRQNRVADIFRQANRARWYARTGVGELAARTDADGHPRTTHHHGTAKDNVTTAPAPRRATAQARKGA